LPAGRPRSRSPTDTAPRRLHPARPPRARRERWSPRDPTTSPNGDTAAVENGRVVIRSPSGAERSLSSADVHAPPGERALLGIAPTWPLYLDDGTLLVGSGDGTLTAFDSAGRRRHAVGFRGIITGLAVAGESLVAATTSRGVVALVGGDGKVRWERQVTAEHLAPPVITKDHVIVTASQRGVFGLSLGGELAFSHASKLLAGPPCASWDPSCHPGWPPDLALHGDEIVAGVGGNDDKLHLRVDGPHPAVASLEPVFPLTFRRVLDASVVSLVPTGAAQVSALVTHRKHRSDYDWNEDDNYEVAQIDGAKITRLPVPHVASKKEVFAKGTHAEKANLFIDALALGPNGNAWVLARRLNGDLCLTGDGVLGRFGGAGQILEVSGGQVRERNDLFQQFFDHFLSTPVAGAPEGTATLFCYGLEAPSCAAYDGATFRTLEPGAPITSVRRVGDAFWLVTENGALLRTDAKKPEKPTPVLQPEGASFTAVAGASEKDAWADFKAPYLLLRFDGKAWTEVPAPAVGRSLSARAPDDAWSGRARWDGAKWSIVHGAPAATAVLARSKDDVWLGDAAALWHGTAPGPQVVRVPAPSSSDDAALPASPPLEMGPPEARYSVERASLEVAGDAPLTGARAIAASPDGVLWLGDRDRVVEIDAGASRATVVRVQGRDAASRWLQPQAKGRGLLLERDEARSPDRRHELRTFDAGRATPEDVQLQGHEAVAVHADPRGATWIVGRTAAEEFAPHALVRDAKDTAFRVVLGLPSAAWTDVAATPDGGAWLAGGLSDGPSGEGILFHAKGHLGEGSSVRYRAPATLLAVAAAGSDEAFAVGAGGALIHVLATGTVARFTLPSGEWLRAVLALAPDDVWIGGDGGTLLHFDGRAAHPVDHPLGAHASITGLALSRGVVWAASPSGVLRIAKR
jgi:hypothetical protein